MGLDMYLFRGDLCQKTVEEGIEGEKYTSYSSYADDDSERGYHKIPGANPCYWRKANAIHKWFVDNVQDGTDDCGYYPVSPAALLGLADLCRHVKQHPEDAPELLPTMGGFFFGDTDYDDYYWGDLQSTIEQIEAALKDAPENAEFIYHSSW